MHPTFDPSKLTDEEITDKLTKAYQYLSHQTQLGHTPTIESIELVIDTLVQEREARFAKMIDEENKKKNPNELKPINLGKINE